MRLIIGILLGVLVLSADPQCGSGSVVNQKGVCVSPKFIEGCFVYSSSTTCFKCSHNYALQNGKCQYLPPASKSCCKTRDLTSGNCEECESGLFLEKNKCVEKKIVGCLSQDIKGACINCDKRFYLENQQCKLSIQNCEEFTTFNEMKICNRCKAGHSFINNTCVPDSILGCKKQMSKGVCNQCYDPFLLKAERCEIPDCKGYNDFGCTACECGFYITRERKCAEMTNGCIRYSRGVCTDCMSNFVLKGGVCEIEGCLKMQGVRCAECRPGYVSNNSIGCEMANCLQSQQGVCNVCKQGYRQKEGGCVTEQKIQA